MISKITKEDNVINRILGAIFKRRVHIAFEMDYFKKYRDFSDGVDFLNIEVKLDIYKGDHTPRKSLFIGLLNFKLVEASVYNVYHITEVDDGNTPDAPYKL